MKKNTGFEKIDSVINKTAKDKKLENALNKSKVLRFWSEAASGFLEEVKQMTKALDFKQGCLVVACLDEELKYKIKILAQRILYALNQMLGKTLVFSLVIES